MHHACVFILKCICPWTPVWPSRVLCGALWIVVFCDSTHLEQFALCTRSWGPREFPMRLVAGRRYLLANVCRPKRTHRVPPGDEGTTVIHVIADISVVYADLRTQNLPKPPPTENKSESSERYAPCYGANQSHAQRLLSRRGVHARERWSEQETRAVTDRLIGDAGIFKEHD